MRKQLGVVLQDGELIPDNIFQNITGTSNCTMEEAWEAAKLAGIHEDINEMPMGMFTYINEGASIISTGQKQRILIARALIGKPKILLFDEATSAIDNIAQKQIVKNLEKIKITKIVIAHRLSTIINADYIYVLDKGRIVQEGKYNKLAKEKGTFQELIKRQSK